MKGLVSVVILGLFEADSCRKGLSWTSPTTRRFGGVSWFVVVWLANEGAVPLNSCVKFLGFRFVLDFLGLFEVLSSPKWTSIGRSSAHFLRRSARERAFEVMPQIWCSHTVFPESKQEMATAFSYFSPSPTDFRKVCRNGWSLPRETSHRGSLDG